MNITRKTVLLLMLSVIYCLIISPLLSVTKEKNDLLFIIRLYENRKYDLAKKQIDLYETEFKNSSQLNEVLFIKANIAFFKKDFNLADSLYSNLLSQNIDNLMLIEILINQASISLDWKDYVKALDYLSKADKVAIEEDSKYQIELIRGKIYMRLFNPISAQQSFSRALEYRVNDPTALLELLNSYIYTNDLNKAQGLFNRVFELNNPNKFSSVINTWLDFLISQEEYNKVIQIESKLSALSIGYDDSIKLRFIKIQYLQSRYSEALVLINKCKSYKAYVSYLTGLIYLGLGQEAEADSIFYNLTKGSLSAGDLLPDSKEDIVINSWLERIKILYKSNPEQAVTNIKNYLSSLPEENQDPYVLYVLSSLQFKSQKYQEAISTLLQVKKMVISAELNHNVHIMLGDIWFNARILDNAKQAYNNYLNLFPQGKFRDHAIYNIALIDFENKAYNESTYQLNTIINSSVNKEFIEKSQFLLAEISYFKTNYQEAIDQLKKIKADYVNQFLVDLRIAQSYYYSENYDAALDYISKLTVTSDNAYQVKMLEGNIYFNQRQYENALKTYYQALGYARTETELQEVNSYLALTLYRLKRFTEATKLYLELTQESESPQAYLIMAAKASYHAKDYQQSLFLFKKYTDENLKGDYYNFALANIGNIYYNLKEYKKAIQTWINLLEQYKTNTYFNEDEQVILSNVFSGLLWCYKLSPDQESLEKINLSIDDYQSEYIKFELQYLLLKIYYDNEQWSDLLQMADNIRAEYPQKENNEIKRYVAASLAKTDRPAEADTIYQEIFNLEPTADILTEWAELEIQTGKYQNAITKFDQAFNLDKTDLRFIRLLREVNNYLPDSLKVYWNKWISSFDVVPEQAQYIWMQWNFEQSNWLIAEIIAQNLILSPDYQIRAQAQLISGLTRYHRQDYENAIIELYKTVYLYADSPQLVFIAKHHILDIFIILNNLDEARIVYSEIKEELSPEDQNKYYNLLNEKQN